MCGTRKIIRPTVLSVKILFFDKEKRKINSYFLALSTEKAQKNDHLRAMSNPKRPRMWSLNTISH